jgi:hypothetical protein
VENNASSALLSPHSKAFLICDLISGSIAMYLLRCPKEDYVTKEYGSGWINAQPDNRAEILQPGQIIKDFLHRNLQAQEVKGVVRSLMAEPL